MGDPYQEARQRYISNALGSPGAITRRINPNPGVENQRRKKRKTVFSRLLKQQKEQLALVGQNTELAKLKYQTALGELKTLTEMQKQELLRNATPD